MARKQSACAQAIRSVKAAIEAAVVTSKEHGAIGSAQFLHLAATFGTMADGYRECGHDETAKACEAAATALAAARTEVNWEWLKG